MYCKVKLYFPPNGFKYHTQECYGLKYNYKKFPCAHATKSHFIPSQPILLITDRPATQRHVNHVKARRPEPGPETEASPEVLCWALQESTSSLRILQPQ